MADSSCAGLIEAYAEWLKQGMSAMPLEGACEITTPFLDRHNDHIQIYVERGENGLRLTDDAYTISDLRASGVDLRSTAKRSDLLDTVVQGFGVRLEGDELVVETGPEDFARKKHNLLQAVLAVGDLVVLARPTVASVFREDVEEYLLSRGVRFSRSIGVPGRSGLDQHFHLLIPPSPSAPERLVESVNQLTRQRLPALIFQWTDVQPNRPQTEMHVFLNDEEPLRADLVGALRNYNMQVHPWSRRDEHVARLVQ
jgi:hypothetical protein